MLDTDCNKQILLRAMMSKNAALALSFISILTGQMRAVTQLDELRQDTQLLDLCSNNYGLLLRAKSQLENMVDDL